MVEGVGQERLGIVGFPAHGGLCVSLLEATGLYPAIPQENGLYAFADPPLDAATNIAPLWQAADSLFGAAGPSGASLSALLDLWQAPPLGLRNGLFPILAIAYVLSRDHSLAVYLDDVFQPRLTSLLTDRLAQDPGCVRLRWNTVSDFHRHILSGVAEVVVRHGGLPDGCVAEPLEIARGLVGVITTLKSWTLKTARLSDTALRVRNLAKLANDPNKFLLDDIPTVFRAAPIGSSLDTLDAEPIIAAVREGLDELVAAYPHMLREIAATLLQELRIPDATVFDIAELHARAANVKGLTGNYRLDAFATRLTAYNGKDEEIEGIASLATNKPSRDWVDRDIDQAQIEIAALAQEFVKAEGLAHVKGRDDRRHALALYFGDPKRPSPVTPEIEIAIHQQAEVTRIVTALRAVLDRAKISRDVALAALAELGSELGEPSPSKMSVPTARSLKRKRVG
jgi:hypothetical protein